MKKHDIVTKDGVLVKVTFLDFEETHDDDPKTVHVRVEYEGQAMEYDLYRSDVRFFMHIMQRWL